MELPILLVTIWLSLLSHFVCSGYELTSLTHEQHQLQQGCVSPSIVCSNTGESCALRNQSHMSFCSYGAPCINGLCAGAGSTSNCTTNSDCALAIIHPDYEVGEDTVCYSQQCKFLKDIPPPLGSHCRAVGQACSNDIDCTLGVSCLGGKCQGIALGGACNSSFQCVARAYCDRQNSICTNRKQNGALAESDEECQSGVVALISTSAGMQLGCADLSALLFTRDIGATCPLGLECKAGLVCDINSICQSASSIPCSSTSPCAQGVCSCGTGDEGVCQIPSCVYDAYRAYYEALATVAMECTLEPYHGDNGCVLPQSLLNIGWRPVDSSLSCAHDTRQCLKVDLEACYTNSFVSSIPSLPKTVCGSEYSGLTEGCQASDSTSIVMGNAAVMYTLPTLFLAAVARLNLPL